MVHSEDIYKSFYNVINPITGFKVTQAFIDDFITDVNKSFQNQVVITPPTLPIRNYTFSDNEYEGSSSILIEIFCTKTKDATIAYDTVCTKLLTNKSNLIVGNIRFGEGEMTSVIAGGISIKIVPVLVSFDYKFTL